MKRSPRPIELELVRTFGRQGYVVLYDGVDASTLDALRQEADAAIADERAALARNDGTASFISRENERFYVAGRHRTRPALAAFVCGELMASICASLLGPNAYIFNELFVCKAPNPHSGFVWHQDYAYLHHHGYGHYPPNLTIWLALDDATEETGALKVLPFDQDSPREIRPHALERDWTREEVADFGDEGPAVLLEVPAGTLIAFSGLLPHASAPNLSRWMRRAHLVQYSAEPIMNGDEPLQLATPVLVGGRWVSEG